MTSHLTQGDLEALVEFMLSLEVSGDW